MVNPPPPPPHYLKHSSNEWLNWSMYTMHPFFNFRNSEKFYNATKINISSFYDTSNYQSAGKKLFLVRLRKIKEAVRPNFSVYLTFQLIFLSKNCSWYEKRWIRFHCCRWEMVGYQGISYLHQRSSMGGERLDIIL